MQDLIPLVIRAVIVAILLIVALAVGYAIFSGTSAATAVSQFNALSGAIQQAYSGQSGFVGLTCATGSACAFLGSSIPSSLMNGVKLGTDNWGGSITIAPATLPGGVANSGFTIEYDSVPSDSCTKIVQQLTGYAQLSVGAGPTLFVPNSATQATPITAAAACSAATNPIIAMYAQG